MKFYNLKKFFLFITAIILTLGLSISFQSLLAAWTAPLANPPTCAAGNPGCDAPLNVGALMQTKSGPLWINTGVSPTGLIVEKGNVGIGTASPGYKLDVNGSVGVAGDIVETSNYGLGLAGMYSPYRYSNVYSMGPAYRLAADGTTSGNLYGIAYSYEPGYGGAGNNAQAKSGLGHQYLIMANGSTVTALGNGVWTSGSVQAGGNLYLSGSAGNYLYNDGTYIKAASYLRAGSGIYSDGWVQSGPGAYMYSGGHLIQAYGYYIYPGSNSGLGDWQTSYYLASSATWGLYTNTSFNAAGGLYDAGNRVYSAVNPPPGNQGYQAGNTLLHSNVGTNAHASCSWAKLKETQIVEGGTYRITYNAGPQCCWGYFAVFKNGTQVGPTHYTTNSDNWWTDDISGWSAGDSIQIYGYGGCAGCGCYAWASELDLYVNGINSIY